MASGRVPKTSIIVFIIIVFSIIKPAVAELLYNNVANVNLLCLLIRLEMVCSFCN